MSETDTPRVAVGGGVAGLTAGYLLCTGRS